MVLEDWCLQALNHWKRLKEFISAAYYPFYLSRISGIYTATPTPQTRKYPQSPDQDDPPTPPFWMLERCIKWHKSWKMGEKMGKKINFPLRFLYINFKIFSTNFNSHWFIAQTLKDLALGFLISFRIIKDFQNSIKFALMFLLKLAYSSQNSLKMHENFRNFAGFHWFLD